jgi:outer membrane lipopolysaccharide assembly protein LptE/RlpB
LRVPPEVGPLRVDARDPYNPVAAGLTRALQRADVLAVQGSEPPTGVLRLVDERWVDGPLLIDDTARVREWATRYIVTFELNGADGETVMPSQAIELSREYAYDATAAFGAGEEQEVIREELQRDMVAAILRRVDAALGDR